MNASRRDSGSVCQLFAYYLPLPSGAALRHNRLAEELVEGDRRIFVLTPKWDGTSPFERINGVDVVRVPLPQQGRRSLKLIVFSMRATIELIRRRKEYSILHSFHYTVPFMPPLVVAKLLGKSVILEDTLIPGKASKLSVRVKNFIERASLRFYDRIVVISSPLRKNVLRAFVPPEKVLLLPPSVDTDRYTSISPQERSEIRSSIGFTEDDVVICFIGAIVPRKGVDVLIDAFTRVASANDRNRLLIVGGEKQTPELRDFGVALRTKLQRAGLSASVVFTGHVKDENKIIDCLHMADIFAFPSRREGFGTVLIEAMAAGLPCVCGEMEGVAYDIFTPPRDGIVLTSLDPLDWARALRQLLSSPSERRRIGRAARERVVSSYSRSLAVESQRRLYDSFNSSNVGS